MSSSDFFFFFKQKTAYEMRISDWSSDVCSSDLFAIVGDALDRAFLGHQAAVGVEQDALFLPAFHRLAHVVAHEVAHVLRTGAEAAGGAQAAVVADADHVRAQRSEEHTSELQSLMRI